MNIYVHSVYTNSSSFSVIRAASQPSYLSLSQGDYPILSDILILIFVCASLWIQFNLNPEEVRKVILIETLSWCMNKLIDE